MLAMQKVEGEKLRFAHLQTVQMHKNPALAQFDCFMMFTKASKTMLTKTP